MHVSVDLSACNCSVCFSGMHFLCCVWSQIEVASFVVCCYTAVLRFLDVFCFGGEMFLFSAQCVFAFSTLGVVCDLC